MNHTCYWIICAVAGATLLTGCQVAPKDAGFGDVQHVVSDRTGQTVQWNGQTTDDQAVATEVRKMLLQPLTADQAVQIALLNNQHLQARLQDLGIARADLVQAGLLKNPVFAASWRFPDKAPHGTDAEYSVAEDFLDLLILPLRKRIAEEQFQNVKLSVAAQIFQIAADVKSAYFTFQAREQLITRLRLVGELNQTAADLAERQHAAGTINDLDLINQQAIYNQSEIDLRHAQTQLIADREHLNRLLGFADDQLTWTISPHLPDIPPNEIPVDDLESLAMRQRLDLAAARAEVATLKKILSTTKGFRYFTTVDVGVDTEHGTDGQNVTGPTLSLEIPIFDQGQGRIAKVQAQFRQVQFRLEAMTIDVRSEIREAQDKMLANRDLAENYRDLLPKRERILNLTLQQYNGMLKGPYDLLLAKESEVTTEQAYLDAWRDYWIARTELTRAVGGHLPTSFSAATRPATTQHDQNNNNQGVQP